ncbi:MgtC/SapB family protein [Acidaminobacter sp. JC074]|uniref:MgtC/SapB family protein n=1 Tax=Acidaminobacter sp. JC074 TaxID=2530199 RepID=UPI001F0F243E|nr:MgtC/SapB family protein [Acidaminobacter sp. JC074]MCH4889646.1 MgtC/SapB family protein [Acidaminobacter sp. JC074]
MLLDVLIRIGLSCLLGGIIGWERESINRPAGLRTHILVCMGASLVMLTSLVMFDRYAVQVNIDPTRLGAQVISGIGFLGAGTIMREGLTVKGLTTAASIWIVGCIGLAVGCGFYEGAIVSTGLSMIVLVFFSKAENFISQKDNEMYLNVETENKSGQIGKIGTELGKLNIRIVNIEMRESKKGTMEISFLTKLPRKIEKPVIIEKIAKLDGINIASIVD